MIKKECFKLVPSTRDDYWVISPICENFHLERTEGSFAVIGARLLNLEYHQYLRFLRDEFHGEIVGKNRLYPVVYFKRSPELDELVRLLNNRANMILWERENSEWLEHQKEMEAQKNAGVAR